MDGIGKIMWCWTLQPIHVLWLKLTISLIWEQALYDPWTQFRGCRLHLAGEDAADILHSIPTVWKFEYVGCVQIYTLIFKCQAGFTRSLMLSSFTPWSLPVLKLRLKPLQTSPAVASVPGIQDDVLVFNNESWRCGFSNLLLSQS